MIASKSRSGKKWHPSILSRTKLCREDSSGSQIDSDALVSLERKPSNLPENQNNNRVLEIVETQMEQLEEEIRVLKEQLSCAEAERSRAVDELREMRQIAQEANYLKEVLRSTRQDLNAKDGKIDRLKSELQKAKQVETILRDAMDNAEGKEDNSRGLLSDYRMRIKDLEEEVENRKLSESKILVLLEQNKVELEARKEEIVALSETIKLVEDSKSCNGGNDGMKELRIEELTDEIASLKNELKLATEAEEKSKKAMDVLALALKEVTEEATEAKENVKLKLTAAELELEQVKKENENLKERIKSIEESHKELDEAKNEMEIERNLVERIRLEAEETLLAWTGKEMGFVSCIKIAEEERDNAKRENSRLRDILKQAISEANAAKASANIAINENSKLKDALADKEDVLHILNQEEERPKTNKNGAPQSRECQERKS